MLVSGAATARFQKVSMPPPPTIGRRDAASNMLNRPTVSAVVGLKACVNSSENMLGFSDG